MIDKLVLYDNELYKIWAHKIDPNYFVVVPVFDNSLPEISVHKADLTILPLTIEDIKHLGIQSFDLFKEVYPEYFI